MFRNATDERLQPLLDSTTMMTGDSPTRRNQMSKFGGWWNVVTLGFGGRNERRRQDKTRLDRADESEKDGSGSQCR